jgi:hypothetical protein
MDIFCMEEKGNISAIFRMFCILSQGLLPWRYCTQTDNWKAVWLPAEKFMPLILITQSSFCKLWFDFYWHASEKKTSACVNVLSSTKYYF